jgi:hypothetical protein
MDNQAVVRIENGKWKPLIGIPKENAHLIELEWTDEQQAHLQTLVGEVHFSGYFWNMEGS